MYHITYIILYHYGTCNIASAIDIQLWGSMGVGNKEAEIAIMQLLQFVCSLMYVAYM